MKKLIIILVLFALIVTDEEEIDPCSSKYENLLKTTCESLSGGTTGYCIYSNSQCIKKYTSCSSYAPSGSETFNDETCRSIEPSNGIYKCIVQGSGTSKTCVQTKKSCSDHDSRDTCINLEIEAGQRCVLLENDQCVAHYESCSGLPRDKCNTNFPKDKSKQCIWSDSCIEKDKECKDYGSDWSDKYTTTSHPSCPNLIAGVGQRCVLLSDDKTCEAHYESCSNAPQEKCNGNIPKGNSNSCIWDKPSGSSEYSCTSIQRLCKDFITFVDNYQSENTATCLDLVSTDQSSKSCYYNEEGNCDEYYTSCSSGNGKQDICPTIKPLNDAKDGFKKFYECTYSGTTCTETLKKCNEYQYDQENVLESDCASLQVTDSNYQKCVYDSDKKKCDVKFKTCDSYNNFVTDPNQRVQKTCEDIYEDDYQECYLDTNKVCKSKEKDCNQITDKDICNSQQLSDKPTKRCLFLSNNTCIETYKTCEDYNSDTSITNKLKDICEVIEPEYADGYIYNCTLKTNSGTTSCEKNKIECEDYKYPDEEKCSALTVNFDTNTKNSFKCTLKNGKCKKEYKTCNNYYGGDKSICESIKLETSEDPDYYRCFLYNDNSCFRQQKICSDYTGNDWHECENKYRASYSGKICAFIDNKCIEKYPIQQDDSYSYCSNYRGTNREECEAILTSNGKKCYYNETFGCMVQKKCSEAKSELECNKMTPEDSAIKQCAYINGQCVEQYKSCSYYNTYEKDIEQSICEDIRININSQNYNTHYCKFTASTTGGKNKCASQKRECSEFILAPLQNQCTSLTISDKTKKCVFENNVCSSKPKTCLELDSLTSITNLSEREEICENAETSSDKKVCRINGNKNGCIEKIKETMENEDCKCPTCSAREKYLGKIILALLLFLSI